MEVEKIQLVAMRRAKQHIGIVIAVLTTIMPSTRVTAESEFKIETVPILSHSMRISSIALSADGKRVLTGSKDNTVKLWETSTGAMLRTFEGHTDPVNSVALSGDGRQALSGSDDKTLKLWDTATGALLRTFRGHSAGVNSVALSADGRRALSGSDDKTIKLWNASTGVLLRTFRGHLGAVTSVAFSPDGRKVLSGSGDNTLKLWDTAAGTLIHTYQGQRGEVHSVVISSDGGRILSSSWDNDLREWDNTLILWDTASGELVRAFNGRSDPVNSVAFSVDGSRALSGSGKLVLGSGDNTLKLWDTATGELLQTYQGHSGGVLSVAFSSDGGRLLSGSWDNTLILWDATTRSQLRTFYGHSGAVNSVAFSSDSRWIVSGSSDNTLILWDSATGSQLRMFNGHSNRVNAVAFSADGKQVLSGSDDKTIKLWNASTGVLLRTFRGHSGAVTSVAFSPDGSLVLSGSDDKTLKLWNAASGTLLHTFDGHSGAIASVAFSDNGRLVLSSDWLGTPKLWDAESGMLLRTFEGNSNAVTSVAFSSDSHHVLLGGRDGTIGIWDVDNRQELVRLIASQDGDWLAMTPEGYFASSSSGAEILNIVRGLEATTISQVHQSLFSPDLVRASLMGDPDGELKAAAKVMNLKLIIDSGPAPKVAIISPPNKTESMSDLVSVTARITDQGKGIGRIEWRVNGITTTVIAKPLGQQREYILTQQVALDLGKNTIEVVAYNDTNLLASLPARTTIRYVGPTDTSVAKLHVLAIGINGYTDRGWTPPGATQPVAFGALGLAVKDATVLSAALQEAGVHQYSEVRVTKVLDSEATVASLETIIDRLARDIQPRDTLVLFAAGHGTALNGHFYMIPFDYQGGTDPAALMSKAISQDRLQDWIANRIKAKRVVILLDTCESGALVGGTSRTRIDVPDSDAAVGRLHEATGRPVLTAAAEGQFAHEGVIGSSGAKQGIFTWAILDALKHGDRNGNGKIELSELVAHVQSEVPALAARLGGQGRSATATPVFGRQSARFGSRGGDFSLVEKMR